ncbi:MAG: hypothetical protein LC541_18150, partial [Candidatus Thiodiazotropha sp.]|nr:hypothetical protein [Candidatus Thiodiazotropha sp.]MCM8885192.1 hypothetical protein [Candidatus Thiodiazotropha sp.]
MSKQTPLFMGLIINLFLSSGCTSVAGALVGWDGARKKKESVPFSLTVFLPFGSPLLALPTLHFSYFSICTQKRVLPRGV